jgi:HipA-like protein
MADALEVYVKGDLAGYLRRRDGKGFVFDYIDAYFNDPAKPSVSLTMPKVEKHYESDVLFPFFYNMLAEGFNRQWQSRALHLDERDYFSLLAATAEVDTIGAVTVKPIQ